MMTGDWAKSSYSQGGANNCVECRRDQVGAQVRDTQNRVLGHLSFDAVEWGVFLDSVKTDAL